MIRNITTAYPATAPGARPTGTMRDLPSRAVVPAIEMAALSKTFGTIKAVDQLTLTVGQGEIFGLLGPNGSGKTTTINMIAGLSVPTSGTVRVLGYQLPGHARQVKRLLGCVPQETALFEDLTAEHNMQFHAALYHVPRSERKERIAAMLELVHLYDRRKHQVRTFSGGMKRRLALARALLHEPKVLYLDEPSLGVDVQNRRVLYEFIRALPEQGVTVLLTTNDMHEAELLCTCVAIIDHGALQVVDTPQNLIRLLHAGVRQVAIALDDPLDAPDVALAIRQLPGIKAVEQQAERLAITTRGGEVPLADILNVIVAQGRSVRTLGLQEPELEEVFLHITGNGLRD
jgi:ABC-2 type transport system ATP-binding protein